MSQSVASASKSWSGKVHNEKNKTNKQNKQTFSLYILFDKRPFKVLTDFSFLHILGCYLLSTNEIVESCKHSYYAI